MNYYLIQITDTNGEFETISCVIDSITHKQQLKDELQLSQFKQSWSNKMNI